MLVNEVQRRIQHRWIARSFAPTWNSGAV